MQYESIVVFDLDGTLLRGNSFHEWIKFLVISPRSGISLRDRFRVVAWCVLRVFRVFSHARLKHRIVREIVVSEKATEIFVRQLIARYRSDRCFSELDMWRSRDACMILATAAPEVYASVLGSQLGFHVTIGSMLEAGGGFSENVREEKMRNLKRRFPHEEFSAVYTDHEDDFLLLGEARSKFLVNPSSKTLRAVSHAFKVDSVSILRD